MLIKSNERVFICGKTGSGKSYLAKKLFRSYPRGIVYDSDLEHSDLGFIVRNIKQLKEAYVKFPKIVYQPSSYGRPEFEQVCEFIFTQTSNLVFFVDEVSDYAPNNSISPIYSMIIRRGRKRGIGTIASTQRVALVDKTVISQSEHLISFFQYLDNDVQKIKDSIGNAAEQTRKLQQYHFLYFNNGIAKVHTPV